MNTMQDQMSEQIETKEGEQYPLLRNDSGGGDSNALFLQPPPIDVTSVCNITRTPKRSWLDRWPEFFSACWITLILIGISFLAFYTLGVNVYRRQPLLITKYNGSMQANTLFYHHIVPSGAYIPFMTYSDYISNVAMQYPLLNINVIFLLDDSIVNAASLKHVKLLKRLTQPTNGNVYDSLDQTNKKEMRNVQKKYPNVNITIMALSKYMAMTPHRYLWRTTPIEYLSFYVRIFAVWQNGGIAMDLGTFNNRFSLHKNLDQRISSILKQHNEGVESTKYLNVLRRINQEEQNELFTLFYLLVSHLFNETTSLFNKPLWLTDPNTGGNMWLETDVLKPKRNKRNSIPSGVKGETDMYSIAMNRITPNTIVMNHTDDNSSGNYQIISNNSVLDNLKNNTKEVMNSTSTEKISIILLNNTKHTNSEMNTIYNSSVITGDAPPIVFFYDVAIVSDNFPIRSEPISMPKHCHKAVPSARIHDNFHLIERPPGTTPILTISPDGTFVATPSKHNPFLENLISYRFEGVSPSFVINRALMSHCGVFKNDVMFCENIFVL